MDVAPIASEQLPKLNAGGINKIFIGSLFVFFSFRFNGFDIFPTFIGYLFIIFGLGSLSVYSGLFKKAMALAFILCLLSFGDIYQVSYGVNTVPQWLLYYAPAAGLLSLILCVSLYYCITYGIANMAEGIGRKETAYNGKRAFGLLLVANLFSYALTIVTLLTAEIIFDSSVFIILGLLLSLLIQISYLVFLRQSYKLLNNASIIYADAVTHRFNLVPVFLSYLLTLSLICASCLFYINKNYLFNALDAPRTLEKQAGLNIKLLRKPLEVLIYVDFTWSEVEGNADEIALELLKKLDTMLTRAIDFDPNRDGVLQGPAFHVNISSSERTVALLSIMASDSNVIQFNSGWFLILPDDDYQELIDYINSIGLRSP
ncbi:MAG: hypothetical protein FWH51_01220 [Dehalococcoidia bacterium]|nr:hypothetical protein [Dehalococcoidia bacterium]